MHLRQICGKKKKKTNKNDAGNNDTDARLCGDSLACASHKSAKALSLDAFGQDRRRSYVRPFAAEK